MDSIEFDFPGSRLEDRASRILEKLAEHPDLSFPNIFGNPSELKVKTRALALYCKIHKTQG